MMILTPFGKWAKYNDLAVGVRTWWLFWATHRVSKSEIWPTHGPCERPQEHLRKPPREHPKGLIFPVLALQGLPSKASTKRPTKVHRSAHESFYSSGRGSPVLFSPVLFLDHLQRMLHVLSVLTKWGLPWIHLSFATGRIYFKNRFFHIEGPDFVL